MPKIGKIGQEDIEFGLSSFSRISRLNPSVNVTRTQINAGHITVSTANYTTAIIPDMFKEVRTSGIAAQTSSRISVSNQEAIRVNVTAISGVVMSNIGLNTSNIMSISADVVTKLGITLVHSSGWRIDAGSVGFSGYIKASHSTALSTISYANANLIEAGIGGLQFSSGQANQVIVGHSGHCLDFYSLRTAVSGYPDPVGVGTSAGTSNIINWMALGI